MELYYTTHRLYLLVSLVAVQSWLTTQKIYFFAAFLSRSSASCTVYGYSRIDHLNAFENERNIPIGPDLIELLQKVKALGLSDTLVFPIRYHTYNDKIKSAATYAGITDLHQIRTHSLRTTEASNIYAKCHDVKTVQAFLGHTTPEMTTKYIKGQDSYNALRGLV